jgi:hypothetical protein
MLFVTVCVPLRPSRSPCDIALQICAPNCRVTRTVSTLEQCPMSIFMLQCPFELSDQASRTSVSICLGVPVTVPYARFLKATVPDYIKSMSGLISFSTIQHMHPTASRSRHSSHERLAYRLSWPGWLAVATKAGLPSSASLTTSAVLCADDYSSRRNNIVTIVAGLNVANDSYQFACPADLITVAQMSNWFTHLTLVINWRRMLLLMLKQGKIGRITLINVPIALLLPGCPAIPLVSKVQISWGNCDLLPIIMSNWLAQALCSVLLSWWAS